jgi:hypothetical protein
MLSSPPEYRSQLRLGESAASPERDPIGGSFYLWLTKLGPGGNPLLRSVCLMTAQPIPALGRDDSGFPRPRTGSYRPMTSEGIYGVCARPGESDPSRMLSGVLMLVTVTIIVALTLAWWLV